MGAAIARRLAASGAAIAVHYRRSAAEAQALVDELRANGGDAAAFGADLSIPEEIDALFASMDEAGVVASIVVNSASSFDPSPTGRVDLDGWNATLAVNLTAPYQVSLRAAERMSDERGDIVNVADVFGFRPLGGYLAYSVSKAGLLMLTKGLARELGPAIRVNAVAPGPVLMPEWYEESDRRRAVARTVLGREGSAEDVAAAVEFLVSGTDYATGSVVTVDGGRSVR